MQQRALALAGVFQAVYLVQEIARHGRVQAQPQGASLYSLLQLDAPATAEVFGGLAGVAYGLRRMQGLLQSNRPEDREVFRYLVALLHLERKLAARPELMEKIGNGLQGTAQRLPHFALDHPNILAQLAEIYSTTISTMQPRIIVLGEPMHLQNPDHVNRIRSLLLAGIRAARLWQQCGGSRLQILFQRHKILAMAEGLLDLLPPPEGEDTP
jgi:high frequency lysogenization protein